jgi:hypothetical protein
MQRMAQQSLFRDFLGFIVQEKKWWMLPLVLILLLLGALALFASSSPLGPLLYPLF